MAVAHQHPYIPIIEVLRRLNVTLEEFISAVTVNKYKYLMSEEEFVNFSKAMITTEGKKLFRYCPFVPNRQKRYDILEKTIQS
jgi:hypothetical protein